MIALDVRELGKNYPLEASQWARLRHVLHAGKAREGSGIWALRNVSFTVDRGEAFGIVGANGSGKSTLLQVIAGILQPTCGEVTVHGRLSALLELGSGFSREFSGRENVFLNASLLGLTEEETEARLPEIERFASIGEFIHQPIRTYSSGMVLRLAFAVVAHVEPEILIVDEALAVGDIAFRQRCMRRIHELRAGGTTILYVSHDTSDVKALCERCLWLEHGEVRAIGESDEVIARYLSASLQRKPTAHATAAPASVTTAANRYGDGRVTITATSLTHRWLVGEPTIIRVAFTANAPVSAPLVGFLVRNARGETILGSNTLREDYPLPALAAGDHREIDFHIAPPNIVGGDYLISVAVSDGSLDHFTVCDYVEDAIRIQIPADDPARGYIHLQTQVVIHRKHGNL